MSLFYFRYFFLCNSWLSAERGSLDLSIPLTPDQQVKHFQHLFQFTATKEFTDDHLWFSVVSRPTRSNFTRVQRLSCCLSLLFTTMIANAMWYGQESELDPGILFKIGPIMLSYTQIRIATMSTLVVFPVNFCIITLFRKSKPSLVKVPHQKYVKESEAIAPDSDKTQLRDNIVNDNFSERKLAWMSENKNPNQTPKKQKSPYPLPHICIYFGWVLLTVSVVASAFFCVLYSLEWGKSRSEQWLTAMLIGFLESVFVIQPVKVHMLLLLM